MKIVLLILAALALSSCATYRPILDENSKYNQVGDAQAEKDIDQCISKADAFLKKHEASRTGKAAARGAGSGAIMGGIMGALTGDFSRAAKSAAVGAGVGAAAGAGGHKMKGDLTPDEVRQRYVSRCLGRQGYDVLGWK